MRTQIAALRWRWRQIPGRTRMGMVIAVVAIAGLIWQHNTANEAAGSHTTPTTAASAPANPTSGQETSTTAAAPTALTPDAARATATRFASNVASPNGSHDDWVARLTPDVMPDLLDQYRSTDISTVTPNTVTDINGPMSTNPAVPTFQVTYADSSRVQVTLEMDAAGWKVSSVVPVSAAPAGPEVASAPVSGNG